MRGLEHGGESFAENKALALVRNLWQTPTITSLPSILDYRTMLSTALFGIQWSSERKTKA